LSILLPSLFLFSPQPDSWNFFKLNNSAGFIVILDSPEFINPAINPQKLLETKQTRQSRPLYILAGSVTGNLIDKLIQHFFHQSIYEMAKEKTGSILLMHLSIYHDAWNKIVPYYIGFVFINFLILVGAALLMTEIVFKLQIPLKLGILSFTIFLVNNVTKNFALTVHQQMFTICTPLLLIWIVLSLGLEKKPFWHYILTTLGCSIFFLIYGNFLLCLPILVGSYAFRSWKNRIKPDYFLKIGIIIFTFIAPTILWIVIVTHYAGYYYNYEISEFRQLVWFFDYVNNLGILKAIYMAIVYTFNFLSTFLDQDIWPFITIGVGYLLYLNYKKQISWYKLEMPDIVCLVVLAVSFLFFWSIGYYRARITFFLVIPIVIWLATKFSNYWLNPKVKLIAWSFVIVWCLKHYLTLGPFL
jgi:hypothetical protein